MDRFWTKNGHILDKILDKKWTKLQCIYTKFNEKRTIYKLLFMLTIFTIYTIKVLLNKISNKLYNKAKAS